MFGNDHWLDIVNTCLPLNILPKFVNFKVPNVLKNANLPTLYTEAVKRERLRKIRELTKINIHVSRTEQVLTSTLSFSNEQLGMFGLIVS